MGAARGDRAGPAVRGDRGRGQPVLRAWRIRLEELEGQIDEHLAGGRARGASTITMQTAKNLFLWPGRDLVRKALEAWFTPQIELLWPKRRIIEVYLNVAEFGPGIYGAEAAARTYFGKSAARAGKARGGAARRGPAQPAQLVAGAADQVSPEPRAHHPHADRPARSDARLRAARLSRSTVAVMSGAGACLAQCMKPIEPSVAAGERVIGGIGRLELRPRLAAVR